MFGRFDIFKKNSIVKKPDGSPTGGPVNVARKIPVQILDKEPKEIILENSLYKKQRDAFAEAFENVAMTAVQDDVERSMITAAFKRSLNVLRKENKLVVPSEEVEEIWKIIAERISQEANLEGESQELLNVLMRRVLADVDSAAEEEKRVDNSELDKKLLDVIAEGEGFYETYGEKLDEKLEGMRSEDDIAVAKEFAKKAGDILDNWNTLFACYEDEGKRTDKLLLDLQALRNSAETVMAEIASWRVAWEIKQEKTKNNRGENSLERVIDWVEMTKNARIEKVRKGEKTGEINIKEINVNGLINEEKEQLKDYIKKASEEISLAKQAASNADVAAQKLDKKNSSVKTIEQEEKIFETKWKSAKKGFEHAIGLIEDAESKDDIKDGEEKYPFDMKQSMREFVQNPPKDLFSEDDHEKWDGIMGIMRLINNESYPKKLVVFEGKTYAVSKVASKGIPAASTTPTAPAAPIAPKTPMAPATKIITDQEKAAQEAARLKEEQEKAVQEAKRLKEEQEKKEQEKKEQEEMEELYKEANKEAYGELLVEEFQGWKDGYKKTLADNDEAKILVEKQIKSDVEYFVEIKGKKKGEDLEKVVKYILDQLK